MTIDDEVEVGRILEQTNILVPDSLTAHQHVNKSVLCQVQLKLIV